MKIKPILTLNQHFNKCEDYSLANSKNIKITKDGVITNDNAITANTTINNAIGTSDNVVGCIPCNDELVIFTNSGKIYRYDESANTCTKVINNFGRNGGLVKGTFTYNIKNELIIAFTEMYDNTNVPLKVINLDTDTNIDNGLFPLVPNTQIPRVEAVTYIPGSAYKGWYHIFIRYKINNVDYTQWYPISYPIFVDEFVNNKIIDYWYSQPANKSRDANISKAGGLELYTEDAFTNNKELCNNSFKFIIDNLDNKYTTYQLAYAITNNDSVKTFVTHDRSDISNRTATVVFNSSSLNKDYKISIQELTTEYYNYFNVKNVINYKNRLYLSNFKENTVNANDIQSKVDNIKVYVRKVPYANTDPITYNANSRSTPETGTLTLKLFKNITRTGTKFVIIEDIIENVKYTYIDDKYRVYINDLFDILKTKHTIKTDSFDYLTIMQFDITDTGDTGVVYTANHNVEDSLNNSYIELSSNWAGIYIKGGYIFKNKDNGSSISQNTDFIYAITGTININGQITLSRLYDILKVELISVNSNTGNNPGGDTGGDNDDPDSPIIPPSNDITEDIKEQNYKFSNDSLLPNEIYNFYIHFVDSYGNYTDGFKLPVYNTITANSDPNKNLINYISYKCGDNVYFIPNNSVLTGDSLYLNQNSIYYTNELNCSYDHTNQLYKITEKLNTITDDLYANLISNLNNFKNNRYKDYRWGDVLPTFFPTKFTNNNNDAFIKTPLVDIRTDKLILQICGHNKSNFTLPTGYIGWFITYEKMERITDTAVIFKSNHDINNNSNLSVIDNTDDKLYKDNTKINYIYSDKFDINDSIKIDYDFIMYNSIIKDKHYVTEYEKAYADPNSKEFSNSYVNANIKTMLNYDNILFNTIIKKELLIADEYANLGKSTRLKCEFTLDFPSLSGTTPRYETYMYSSIVMVKLTKNIYNNKIKELIKLNGPYYNRNYVINNGYNGKITTNSVHYYNNVLFDDSTNIIKSAYTTLPYYGSLSLKFTSVGDDDNNEKPYRHYAFLYLQNLTYDTYYHESKEYNNKPLIKSYIIKITDNNRSLENRNIPGTFVTPANSTDLFKNNRNLNEPIKTYTNYNPDKLIITNYDNRIIQSNVISSESAINNWRKFNVTEYKDINDNKGKITNIVGVGDLFLVHTEHSMFILDVNNYLVAIDKTVKTEDKELLEINHKEVFTSQVGFGGLQDSTSWIAGTFGYIWFDGDSNRFMRYDNGKFDFIDKNIFNYINVANPYNVRFADDKDNGRLLISFNPKTAGRYCISYNYNINSFVSIHDEDNNFNYAYNTKNRLYLTKTEKHTIHNISNNVKSNCKISIIVNTEYELIKYLEFITYKLFTVTNPAVNILTAYSPVGGKSHIYAGDSLTIYNDLVNTGKLDISNDQDNAINSTLNSDWQKPYFHLGNWNVNKLYDAKNADTQYGFIDKNSRLYGNYFIIEFEFNTNERFEFEELNCQFTTKIN